MQPAEGRYLFVKVVFTIDLESVGSVCMIYSRSNTFSNEESTFLISTGEATL